MIRDSLVLEKIEDGYIYFNNIFKCLFRLCFVLMFE